LGHEIFTTEDTEDTQAVNQYLCSSMFSLASVLSMSSVVQSRGLNL
jgi:hypothetical protein